MAGITVPTVPKAPRSGRRFPPIPGSLPLSWFLPGARAGAAPAVEPGPAVEVEPPAELSGNCVERVEVAPGPAPELPRPVAWSELAEWRWGPALLPEGHPDREIDEPPNVLRLEQEP